MKKMYFFSTKIWYFLTEIPVIALFILTLTSSTPLKFLPLMLVCVAGAVLIFLYFFRMMIFSYDEVRCTGIFSSRDKALLNKGKTLILTRAPGGKLRVEVFGTESRTAALEWLRDEAPQGITLLRGRCLGANRALCRILRFYHVPPAEFAAILGEEPYEKSFPEVAVRAEIRDDRRRVELLFLTTMEAN